MEPRLVSLPDVGMLELMTDAPAIESPSHREFLEALGIAVYTTDADGRITFYNQAAAEFWGREPALGELWCGSWRLFWPDGRPMAHEECPMSIALREGRTVRGYEAIAERPDGSRAAFVPYPTVIRDRRGALVGAINVLVDVTEQRRVEDALRTATAVKDEFMGLVSHELRTPVTTIFGNARLLRDRLSLPEPQAAMVADIAIDAERLLGVVENLLLLTRGEAVADLDPEPQVLAHVLRRLIATHRQRNPARTITIDAEPRHLIVEADRTYLELLVGNLLSNADKYSPITEPIEIVVRAVDSEAHVTVLDRGIGIDGEDEARVFGIFYRSDAARRVGSGLGIGLSACRLVVTLLGGRIWGHPRPGGGSEFGFALPLAPEVVD